MKKLILFCLLCLITFSSYGSEFCPMGEKIIAECFDIKGTLTLWNGTPTFRLQVSDSKRILGIKQIPPKYKFEWKKKYFGSFRVCPLNLQKKGQMQMVCLVSVKSLKASKRN